MARRPETHPTTDAGPGGADPARTRPSRPVTSVEVARAAGVSQATVSRVLNGKRVSEDKRRHVLAAMQRLGYQPNAIARSMVTRRTGVIGVVVSDIANVFYPEILEAITGRLTEVGLRMLLINAAGRDDASSARLLIESRVDGAIFTTATQHSESVHETVERHFPVVFANRAVEEDADIVVADNARGAELAADHLLGLGHRRIAMVSGHPDASTAIERGRGFAERLRAAGAPVAPELDLRADFDYDRAARAVREVLRRPEPPTAIFCQNDWTAFAALNAARAEGVATPERLSIVGFDDVRMASWETFELTTVRQPIGSLARTAVELLLTRLDDPEQPPRTVTYPCELVVRRTSGPCPP